MPEQRPTIRATFLTDDGPEDSEPVVTRRLHPLSAGLLLVALVLIVYAPALRGQFIFHDDVTVTENIALRTWRGLPAIWLHPTVTPAYQPVSNTLLFLEYQLFRARSPGGYLLVNILLHLATTLGLWRLLMREDVRGCLPIAALFGVHPINLNAVCWISQQPLLLSAALSIGSVLALGSISRNQDVEARDRFRAITAVALFVAALLSHVAAVCVPAIMVLFRWWRGWHPDASTRRVLWCQMVLAMAWLGLILLIESRRGSSSETVGMTWVHAAVLLPQIALLELRHLVFPASLAFAYEGHGFNTVRFWIPLLVAALLAGWAAMRIAHMRVSARGLVFVWAMVGAAVFPILLIPRPTAEIALASDHIAYFANIVLIVAIVQLVLRATSNRAHQIALRAFAIGTVVMLAVQTMSLASDYRTPASVWESCLRVNSNFAAAHTELGLVKLNHERSITAANEKFRKALIIKPNDVRTLICLGEALELDGRPGEAIMQYHQALAIKPENIQARFGLARALAQQGNSEAAIREYMQVVATNPHHALAYNNLGLLYAERGETDLAAAAYEKAISAKGDFWQVHINLANLQFSRGAIEEAAATLLNVVQRDPRNFEAWLNAGAMTGELAQRSTDASQRATFLDQSITYLQHALALRPGSAAANHNLGVGYLKQEKPELALHYLQRASELEPDNALYQQTLSRAKARHPEAVVAPRNGEKS